MKIPSTCLHCVAGLLIFLPPATAQMEPMKVFTPSARILFQGDSITDGNRGRSADPNHILGHGYQFIISSRFGAAYADRKLTFLNRGVSGNTLTSLSNRWQTDTIALTPDILSILVGINDMTQGVTPERFEEQYDQLLADTVKALPNVRLILGEPFGLPTGKYNNDKADERREDLRKRQEAVARLATKYRAALVHYQKAFDEAVKRAPADYWIWDGIHPTYPGHQIMADEWIRTVNQFWP